MNEFKGTQSDWIEAGHNDNGIFISGGNSQDAIALVYYNNNTVKIGEGKANARLIANAKQLMEFAQDFVDKVESGRAKSVDSYQKAKDVLNKILIEE